MSVAGSSLASMESKPARRPQLRTLVCPACGERGLLKPLLWGMPDESFDHGKYESGGCLPPSSMPPDCRCTGCGQDWYRDGVSGFNN